MGNSFPCLYHRNVQNSTNNRAKMTQSERKRRMKHLPNGLRGLEEMLAKAAPTGKAPIVARTIGKILAGERSDRHGVIELFRAVTNAEIARKSKLAKELAANLES